MKKKELSSQSEKTKVKTFVFSLWEEYLFCIVNFLKSDSTWSCDRLEEKKKTKTTWGRSHCLQAKTFEAL